VTEQLKPLILFEDTHLVVLSKPAGLLSQGEESGSDNVVDWARAYFGRHYVGLVHRLDRNTSGLMVVAKRSKAAERLTNALQGGKLKRSYLAWVQGRIDGPLSWRHFLSKDAEKNVVRVVDKSVEGAKEAVLQASPLEYAAIDSLPMTLLRFELQTGRSHQIRVQSAFEGFPLVGDLKYGDKTLRGAARTFGRPALHSAELSFPHPMSHEVMTFKDPLPADMEGLRTRAR
jgi:23S rRNA pseudouridine1911/1915/1917 synthase